MSKTTINLATEAEVGQVWECTQGHAHTIVEIVPGDECPIKTVCDTLLGNWAWSASGVIYSGPPSVANRLVSRVAEIEEDGK